MAIVQISKIIHRTGANTDLPQLDEGELGFATDDRKLYIGNDPLLHSAEGANNTTQTEILTEVSLINKKDDYDANIIHARIDGLANTTFNISSFRTGQLLVGSGNTAVATTIVNWSGNKLGNTNTYKLQLGNIANITITGGSANQFLQTDGTGNLTWVTVTSNGGGGTSLPALSGNANLVLSTNGSAVQWSNIYANTNTLMTSAVRTRLSASTTAGRIGNISYSNSTGVITYTGPDVTDVANYFSSGTGTTVDSSFGSIQINIGQDVSTTSDVTFANVVSDSLTVNSLTVPTNTVIGGVAIVDNTGKLYSSDSTYFKFDSSNSELSVSSFVADSANIGSIFLPPFKTIGSNNDISYPGKIGEMCVDSDYLYVCTGMSGAVPQWKRLALSSF